MEIAIIQNKIYEIRNQYVILDFDLAAMYQVETRRLNEAVKRNIKRFPPDFMFQLTKEEWDNLMSQIATSSWGGTRKLPYVFTEQGIAMLSGLLNSDIAINTNIKIMRAFVAFRNYLFRFMSFKTMEERIKNIEKTNEKLFKNINELSENTRSNFDDIYIALSELNAKQEVINENNNKPRPRVGYI